MLLFEQEVEEMLLDLRFVPGDVKPGMSSEKDAGVDTSRGCIRGVEHKTDVSIQDGLALGHHLLHSLPILLWEVFYKLLCLLTLGTVIS